MPSRIGVAIATLVAIAIRVPLLFRPLRTDEAATVLYYAAHPLAVGLTVYGSPNNHVFHTALVHFALGIFGPAEWAIRLPALIAGVALVPLAYLAARRLGAGTGLLTAAIVATQPIFVDYSTDGRGYTLVCAFTLLATLAASRIRRDARLCARSSGASVTPSEGCGRTAVRPYGFLADWTAVMAFAVSVALGLWTIPIMIYPFILLTTWILFSPQWRVGLAASVVAVLLTAALYTPLLIVSGFGAIVSNPWVRPVPWPAFFGALPHLLSFTWRSWMSAVPLPLAVVLGVALIAGAIRARMTLWVGLLPLLLFVLAQHTIPFPRTWLPLWVLASVAMGASIPARAEPVAALLIAAMLTWCSLRVPRRPETGELPHVREVARFLAANAAPNDAIGTLAPSDVPLAFYLDARPLRPDRSARRIFVITNEEFGQFLAKTLLELALDPRDFTIAKRADFGDAAIYQLDRR